MNALGVLPSLGDNNRSVYCSSETGDSILEVNLK